MSYWLHYPTSVHVAPCACAHMSNIFLGMYGGSFCDADGGGLNQDLGRSGNSRPQELFRSGNTAVGEIGTVLYRDRRKLAFPDESEEGTIRKKPIKSQVFSLNNGD